MFDIDLRMPAYTIKIKSNNIYNWKCESFKLI